MSYVALSAGIYYGYGPGQGPRTDNTASCFDSSRQHRDNVSDRACKWSKNHSSGDKRGFASIILIEQQHHLIESEFVQSKTGQEAVLTGWKTIEPFVCINKPMESFRVIGQGANVIEVTTHYEAK